MSTTPAPEGAFDAIAAARHAAADRLVTPWWYHPVLGLLWAAFIGSISLGDGPEMLIGPAVFFVGATLLVVVYKRLTGVWVTGVEAGPAARGLNAAMIIVVAIALVIGTQLGDTTASWIVWVLAVLVAAATVALGRRYDEALRAHLRGRA